ncbi:MAG: insulinase family protein [Chloroflexi bacterium]|nr:insulinase family protein [Chloroflexota bacterium]
MTNLVEFHLANGLLVLLKPIHTSPVATFWIWYRVGSRNEVPGCTGVSHWVEHMLFKGTPTFHKGEIFRLVNRNGGVNNALTFTDFTNYHETLPCDRIDLALQIESDRMVNALFDPAEVASERTVIISEREGAENDPRFWLDEAVQAETFKVHPYHHETFGWKNDLQAITRDDLFRHYKKYYAPNNAVVVVAGDFDSVELRTKIESMFGMIPRKETIPSVLCVEPTQTSERRVTVQRPAPTSYFQTNYHGPSTSTPDFFPVLVLKSALSGVSLMSYDGKGAVSKSSRLYRALVETELASDVNCGFRMTLDPGTIEVTATARRDVDMARIERTIFDELKKIQCELITDEEFDQIVKQTEAQFVYANDGISNWGYWLGILEMVASHKMSESFLDKVRCVTKADVMRVAAQYLAETNRTVGWLVPK